MTMGLPAVESTLLLTTSLFRVDTTEGWQLLRRHFDLTTGFSFILVTVPDEWALDLVRPMLRTILPTGTSWQRVVFEPTEPLERLSEQLLNLSVPEATAALWLDSDPPEGFHNSWWEERGPAWRQALARLNRYRNTLQARIPCTLVLAGPPRLVEIVREAAPDIWAIRSGIFRLEPPGTTLPAVLRDATSAWISTNSERADLGDPADTLAEAAKLRGKPGRELLLVQLLARAGTQAQRGAQWGLAQQCLEEAYSLEQTHGADPLLRFELAVNLTELFFELANYPRSKFYAGRAKEIAERFFGLNSPQLASALNNLALVLKTTNRLTEAEPLMRRALAISEASFGNDHPTVARSLNNLAQLLKDTNRLSEAEPLFANAVDIVLRSLGIDHPNSKTVLENYRQLLQALGHSEAAVNDRGQAKLQGKDAEQRSPAQIT